MRIKITTRDGKIVSGRGNLKDAFASLKDGDHAVAIKGWDRTLDQNAYYWRCLGIIGDHMGYHKKEVHEEMIRMFSPIVTYRRFDGKPEQKNQRTSDMSVSEMSRHIELMIQFAAEENVKLPIPEKR